jgi:hypothetical protein
MMALNSRVIQEGLDFILSHFCEPIFPRTISTAGTYGAQVLAFNKEEVIQKFLAASMLDCRINAYPAHTEYKGINRQAPNFIFIDLDRSSFIIEKSHILALDKTLENIRRLGPQPTVLWSGNGYHVYLPINAFVLEQEEVFAKYEQPSKKFLRFAARYLSNHKSDSNNNPSLKSCMIRIPGTHNAKRIPNSDVKVIQVWNGYRLPINYLLRDFRRYLIDQRMGEVKAQHKRQQNYQCFKGGNNIIQWIERLLLTSIPDYRKLAIWHILAPYLITKRGLSQDEAYIIIQEWLNRCNELQGLNFNPHHKITAALKSAYGFFPVSCDMLKVENESFYDLLREHGVMK